MADIWRNNRVVFGAGATDWAALQAEGEARYGAAAALAARRVAFVVDGVRGAFAAVAYGMAFDLDWGVIEASRLTPDVEARFDSHGVALIGPDGTVLNAPEPGEVQPGRITVLTSGSTGLLKLIPHTADTLNTFDRLREMPPQAWFLPYQIGSYAWYQMVALGLFVPDQTLVPGDIDDLAASFAAALARGGVTAISSTPTFWRYALMSIAPETLAAAGLRNISMGGEIVDQAILDTLAALYPEARIRHIYASSEAGAAIVVTDGRAGFDAALLDRPGTIGVRIEDGRLFIRSPYATKAGGEDWIDTGDLVERRGDRIHFCGRVGNTMINVGGNKAFPPDIEAHLMRHPDVVWAQVTARRAPLVGNLPVAAVVLRQPLDEEAAEAMLAAHCEGALAEYAIPRMWEFLDRVPLKASLKS